MTFVVFAVCREPTKYRHPSAGRKKTRQGQSLFTPSAKQRNAPERAHFAKAKNANCSYATVRSPAHDRHEPRRHIDRRSVPQCHHGSIRPTELRLALPRLWSRERADDRDVPLQAVAEGGCNVVTVHLMIWKNHVPVPKCGAEENSRTMSESYRMVDCAACLDCSWCDGTKKILDGFGDESDCGHCVEKDGKP